LGIEQSSVNKYANNRHCDYTTHHLPDSII
jgi:hypothetical protein